MHNLYKQTTQLAIVITRHFGHGFLQRVEHCSTRCQISVPEKIDADSQYTPAENRYRFSGTGFR